MLVFIHIYRKSFASKSNNHFISQDVNMWHKLEPRSAGVVRVVIRVNMTSLQLHSAGALGQHNLLLAIADSLRVYLKKEIILHTYMKM